MIVMYDNGDFENEYLMMGRSYRRIIIQAIKESNIPTRDEEPKLDSIKDYIDENVKSKIDHLENELKSLIVTKGEFESFKSQINIYELWTIINEMKNNENSINSKVETLSGNVESGVNKVNSLGKLLFGSVDENTCGAIQKLRDEFNSKFNELKGCIQDAEKLQSALNEKNEELTRLKTNLESVNNEKIKKEESLKQITQNKESLEQKLADTQKQLSMLNGLKDGYDDISNDKKRLESELAIWKDFAKTYNPVKEAIEDCQTVQSLRDKYNIENIQDYIRVIGENIDFAKAVHDKAKQSKLENAVGITPEEKRVYSALNDCYRQVWGIDFDIFTQPNGNAVSDDFEKKEFDSSREINLINPRDKNSRYSQELYVPLLKNKNGDIYAKAQVKAGNI